MKLKRLSPAPYLALLVTALLIASGMFYFNQEVAQAGVQDTGRSDAKPVQKAARSKAPKTNVLGGTAPANDNCANAVALTGANCPFTATVNTVGASDEVGEPQSTCTLQENSVWYSFTNTSANVAQVTVETCTGTDFDTAIMVWEVTAGACDFGAFVPVVCNDDACGDGLQSRVSFLADPGATYKIQIGGFDGDTGTLGVSIDCVEFACPPLTINGTLGSGDPDFPGVQSSGTQTGRLNRNGIGSSCAAPKTCLPFDTTPGRAFDAYQIPNESNEDACVTINLEVLTQTSANYQSNAYLNTYDPANLCTGYLGDPGLSSGSPPTPTSFSVVVPAGQTLIVVVHTTNPGEMGGQYTLTVIGDLCAGFDICVQQNNNPNQFIQFSSTTGAYVYRDCSKNVTIEGVGIVTQSFCKIQLTSQGADPKKPDRLIDIIVNPCTNTGNATVRVPSNKLVANIMDSNIMNNTCACPD